MTLPSKQLWLRDEAAKRWKHKSCALEEVRGTYEAVGFSNLIPSFIETEGWSARPAKNTCTTTAYSTAAS